MLGREGQKGKKQEDSGPVRVVRTVGALPSVGNRWRGDAIYGCTPACVSASKSRVSA